MPVVTTATVIAPSDSSFAGRVGPFPYGGSLFAVSSFDGTNGDPVQVFKSADNGATWSICDSGNAPSKQQSSASYRSGNVLTIAYLKDGTLELSIVTFDLTTELYGSEESSGLFPPTDPYEVGVCASGFVLVLASTTDTYYQRLSGVWSAVVYETISPTEVAPILGLVIDPNDDIHLFYLFQDVISGARTSYHARLHNDGTLDTRQLLSGPTSQPHTYGRGTVIGTQIVQPVTYSEEDFSSDSLYAYVSDVYNSAAPTWTTELIQSGLAFAYQPAASAFSDGATAAVFFAGITIVYYATTDGSGSWSSPIAWYDPGGTPLMIDVSAELLSAGVYGAVCLQSFPANNFISMIDNSAPVARVMNYIWSS